MCIILSFLSDKEVQASQEINRVENNEDTFANIIIEVLRYARRLHKIIISIIVEDWRVIIASFDILQLT